MENIYKLLNECINFKSLDTIIEKILKNYKTIILLKDLKYDLNYEMFNIDLYKKDDYSSKNIFTMFRILEKKIYKLFSKQNDINLKYSDEVNNKDNNYNYIVVITNNKRNLNFYKVFLIFYYLNLKFTSKDCYLGIDFEFNTKKVALMQINFEQINPEIFDTSFIFMFDPVQFNENWKLFFVQKIICNLGCYKILHGSDSLDIPYLYYELLYNDIKYIEKFNKMFIDTKFLCEFKYYVNNMDLGKCKIYHVLKDEQVITTSKYNELLENERQMGPIYDIVINVNKMSSNLIKYTLYDVIYLYHLVKKYSLLKEYKLIIELTQFIFLEKRNITNNIPSEEISKINNFFIVNNKNKIRLNDIFRAYLEDQIKKNILLKNILSINYFKNTVINLLKYYFFKSLCNKMTIYEKISKERLIYNNQILNFKNSYNFIYFKKIIVDFSNIENDKINEL